jgi:hypothetical protein
MELWLKKSNLTNFADDTETDFSSKEKSEIKVSLEEDANYVLDFMASNGLVANQLKTEFLVLNEKNKEDGILHQIKVGGTQIERTDSTKLLGINIDDAQDWSNHYKSLKNALNQRLFIIRRVQRQLPKEKIMSIVHSLWVSKLRYGLQLCTKVQHSTEERKCTAMKSLQLTQNRMLRAINNSKIKDKISIVSMLKKFNLLSVNQLAASIKLTEVWKSLNVVDYPLQLDPYNQTTTTLSLDLRPKPSRVFNDSARLQISKYSFNVDSARLWNQAPPEVTSAPTLDAAKSAIKTYANSLPV